MTDSDGAREVRMVEPGGGPSVHMPGFGAIFKIRSADTGGEIAILEHPFAVGTITAAHRHVREDEHSIVIEGRVGFRSDDTEVVLGVGGFITKPRGQTHAMWNAGDTPARIIEVITPGRFEHYFEELAELLSQARTPTDPGARQTPSQNHAEPPFSALADRYAITYDEPAWMADVVARFGLKPPSH